MTMDIYKAAGVIVQNKQLLVARSKGKTHFFAPGGKIEGDETFEEALIRELKEELKMDIKAGDYELFGSFDAEADDKPGVQLHMTTFLIKRYDGILEPDNEIEELCWVDTKNMDVIPMGSIFKHEVLPRLIARGLVS